MKSKWYSIAGIVLSILLFGAAIWFLIQTFRKYDAGLLMHQLGSIPASHVAIAAFLSACSYLALSLYDFLALKHIGHALSWKKTLFVSFVTHALSNNIGLSMLSGSSLRLRLYSGIGMGAVDIVKIIAFCNLTFLIGFMTMGGLLLALMPPVLPNASVPASSLRIIGLAMLLFSAFYLFFSARPQGHLRLGPWKVGLPTLRRSIAQILAASSDWIITGSILFFLLPPGSVPFGFFISVFLAAHFAGIASNIPGGLGVFEAMVLLLLSPLVPEPIILGSIVAYRTVYYLIPLCIGVTLFIVHEAHGRGHYFVAFLRWCLGRKA
jgi:uncharacterized membrane protein YbhN (UPF0104 family)